MSQYSNHYPESIRTETDWLEYSQWADRLPVPCRTCAGRGEFAVGAQRVTCPECNGSGQSESEVS